MKKKITSIIIAVAVLLSCSFVVPTTMHSNDCFAKSKTKYVKIKKTTYEKMKKTISNQSTAIKNQSKAITSYKNTVNSQKTTIANQKATIAEQKLTISEKEQTIKDKKQTISWLWSTLEDFGYYYDYDTHKWESDGTEEEEEEVESDHAISYVDMSEDSSQIDIIRDQTGLAVDSVQLFGSYNDWAAYYVEADGDLYVITVKAENVDVVSQLN